jgi:glycosyltransferase involved in cell wall biosynthesis
MSHKVLLFFPHNPYPAATGAHKRALEMLWGLHELGCEVSFISSTGTSERKWQASSAEYLKTHGVSRFHLHTPSALELKVSALLKRGSRLLRGGDLALNSKLKCPIGMHQWFSRIVEGEAPDILMMNYIFWDSLVNHGQLQSVTRVVDSHDLLSVNEQMRRVLNRYIIPNRRWSDRFDSLALTEEFFNRLSIGASSEEFNIYDKYDFAIAISEVEAKQIRENTSNTKTRFIPMTQEPCYDFNSYDRHALFVAGPNIFNLQGYAYFIKRVMPLILKRLSSFCLQVNGSMVEKYQLAAEAGVSLMGFVQDLKPVYESSRFFICPVFGGTGQQVKVVEAMAHGLPVIALAAAARSSPIQHGVNGLVAANAQEFAEHVVQLWNDRQLCMRLGQAARDTIAAGFSKERLIQGLSTILKA